jgi:hypothetical protein
MLQAIQSRITGRIVLVLFILTNTVYFAMLNYSIPELMSTSDGLPIFDMSPSGYSYQQALVLLSNLGEEGRNFYLSTQLVLDLFYPLLFALCYSSLLQWLIKLIQLKNHAWSVLSFVPFLACAFDYAENVAIWLMLSSYPDLSNTLVTISSGLTVTKSILTMAYFTGLMIVLILVAIHFYKVRMVRDAGK